MSTLPTGDERRPAVAAGGDNAPFPLTELEELLASDNREAAARQILDRLDHMGRQLAGLRDSGLNAGDFSRCNLMLGAVQAARSFISRLCNG
ncbi:MAG: hypothetical protein ACOYJQ_00360 [Pseudochelatococcus sp.]|jgi:hypothetical protein|uniref:hypothetical protein n=1 Tax=Pseudochelatococcus sp. TaxID=2020869 RepID=UPI003D93E7EF